MQPTIDLYTKTCKADPVSIQEDVTTRRRGRSLSTTVTTAINYVGPYGNSLSTENDGSFDQDYQGGYLVDVNDNDYITLVGNAWKAFRLEKPYAVTKNTRVEFDFTVFKEAQGHAICFENDLNEDTFGGTLIRCLMLAGKQFSKWENVKKLSLTETLGGTATQSTTMNGAEAGKAADGDLRQRYDGKGLGLGVLGRILR
jgi:hypothetical protein